MKYPSVTKLSRSLKADGIPNSFTIGDFRAGTHFYVRVYEVKVSWRGMPNRKLERLLQEIPLDMVPTLIGTDWKFEECETTQFFLKLRLKYGI